MTRYLQARRHPAAASLLVLLLVTMLMVTTARPAEALWQDVIRTAAPPAVGGGAVGGALKYGIIAPGAVAAGKLILVGVAVAGVSYAGYQGYQYLIAEGEELGDGAEVEYVQAVFQPVPSHSEVTPVGDRTITVWMDGEGDTHWTDTFTVAVNVAAVSSECGSRVRTRTPSFSPGGMWSGDFIHSPYNSVVSGANLGAGTHTFTWTRGDVHSLSNISWSVRQDVWWRPSTSGGSCTSAFQTVEARWEDSTVSTQTGQDPGLQLEPWETTAEMECVEWGTTNTTTVSATSDPYLPADGVVTTPEVLCPEDHRPSSLDVWAHPENDPTSSASETITHWEADPRWGEPSDPWADCMYFATEPCELKLQKATQTEQGWQWEDCDPTLGNCHDWTLDPQRTDLYRCVWGTQVVSLNQCAGLSTFYNIGTSSQTITDTGFQTTPEGEIIPQPQPDLDSPPTTGEPGTGTGQLIGEPSTVDSPTWAPGVGIQDGCWPSGWGLLNPLEWVLRPTQCALVWAFTPSATTMSEMEALRQTAMTKAPASYFVEVSDALAPGGTVGEDCWNVTVDLSTGAVEDLEYAVIDSCGSGPVWTWFQQQRPLLGTFVWAFFITPMAWWAWRQYAPGSQGSA